MSGQPLLQDLCSKHGLVLVPSGAKTSQPLGVLQPWQLPECSDTPHRETPTDPRAAEALFEVALIPLHAVPSALHLRPSLAE